MRRRAEEISATVAGRRLPVPAADDEIARLARTLNEMLARLEAGFERERRFVADASHELRTPLALLKAELELALRQPRVAEELRAAIASAAEETDRLVRLAEDLLVLARVGRGAAADRGASRSTRASCSTPSRGASSAARGDAGRALEVDAPAGSPRYGDRLRLSRRSATSSTTRSATAAGTVRLERATAERLRRAARERRGGRLPADYLPHAFERFSRDDGGRVRGSTGLGLAIVQAIARAHGGRPRPGTRPTAGRRSRSCCAEG